MLYLPQGYMKSITVLFIIIISILNISSFLFTTVDAINNIPFAPPITDNNNASNGFFTLFPFGNGDQYLYFNGQLNAAVFNNTGRSDYLSLTLSNQFLSNYSAHSVVIQFYDRDSRQPLITLKQYSIEASDRDIYVDIPLSYDLTQFETNTITYSGFFRVLKRGKSRGNYISDDDQKDDLLASTNWQILATYNPESGTQTFWRANINYVFPASSTPFHPDLTTIASSPLKNTSPIQEVKLDLNSLDNDGHDNSQLADQDRICTNPLSNSFSCNRFQIVRTPAGSTQFQYSFRAFISELQAPVIGFNVTLFGGMFGQVYDKSGCKMNSLLTRIDSQSVDDESGLFHANILLRDAYQRASKDDPDPTKHYTYFQPGSPLDIWCWFVTDLYHPTIAAGVSIELIPDPIVVSPLDSFVINFFTPISTKLDTTTNHVINPFRAMYNIHEVSENEQPPEPVDPVDPDVEVVELISKPHVSGERSSSVSGALNIINNRRDLDSDHRIYQQITCKWFITSEIPLTITNFNDTMQLAVYNIHKRSNIEQTHMTFSIPAPQVGQSVLKNTNLVLFHDRLDVIEFVTDVSTATTRILFDETTPLVDPSVLPMLDDTSVTTLSFSVLTSIKPSQLDGLPLSTPQCTLQYQQLYPDYHSPTTPTRLPMFYTLTNKPSLTIFSSPHQWMFTATEIETHPSKYSFDIIILNMTNPRPIKWVIFNLVTSEYRFEGDFSKDCIIGTNHREKRDHDDNNPIDNNSQPSFTSAQSSPTLRDDPPPPPPPMDYDYVRPIGEDQQYIDSDLWTTALGFDFYYEPNRYYSIECPKLYLIKSNLNHTSAFKSESTSTTSPLFKDGQRNDLRKDKDDVEVKDEGDSIIQVTMMGLENDSYVTSYDDYYYSVGTIRFTHNDDNSKYRDRLKRLLLQLTLVTAVIIGLFLIFCCFFLDKPPMRSQLPVRTSGNNYSSTDPSAINGGYQQGDYNQHDQYQPPRIPQH